MSMDFALVVSALVFAAAHFSWERLLPLSLLVRPHPLACPDRIDCAELRFGLV